MATSRIGGGEWRTGRSRWRPSWDSRPVALALLSLAAFGCEVSWLAPEEPRARNVLLISMDTLRADHLGCYGYARPTSPNIDRLAAAGTRFENASSTAAWTSPAHGSIFTSRHPSQLGIVRYLGRERAQPLADAETTLAELLRDAGYETRAFTGGGYVSAELGFGQGFDEYLEFEHLQEYVDELLSWLQGRESGAPLFLFVHFYNLHRPYIAPDEEYRARFRGDYAGRFPVRRVCDTRLWPLSQEDRDFVVSQYDGEIAHADAELGRLLSGLDALGARDDLLVAFLSDHGEEFFEHGGCDHVSSVYQELIHVPMVFQGPGIAPAAVVDVPVSLLDVAPTLLDYLGLAVPASMEGRSLLPSLRGKEQPAVDQYFESGSRKHARRGLRSGDYKLVFDFDQRPRELYDLGADPSEEHDLLSSIDASTRRDLVGRSIAWSRRVSHSAAGMGAEAGSDASSDGESHGMSPKLREQLRELGYAE